MVPQHGFGEGGRSAATTFQLEYDEEVAFTAKRRIFDYAKYRDLPFAMTVSFIHPHDPYVARPEFWDRYEGVEIDLPTSPLAEDPHSLRLRSAIEATDVSVTDEQIANARRAYYANTTYVDSKIGEIVRTLEEAELLDDTIVVFTGDHGDMLGERGLWYKMSTLDHSMRVPLVMAGPGIVQVSPEPCSLVDMLPTMLDWAAPGGGRRWAWTSTAARWSLQQQVRRRPWRDGARRILRGGLGAPDLHDSAWPVEVRPCDIDPPMLFDMDADPDELQNLAADPSYAELEAAFASEVRERWDSAQIRADVLASQRMRRAVHAGMSAGRGSTGTISRGAMPPRSMSATTWIGPWRRRPPGSRRSPAPGRS